MITQLAKSMSKVIIDGDLPSFSLYAKCRRAFVWRTCHVYKSRRYPRQDVFEFFFDNFSLKNEMDRTTTNSVPIKSWTFSLVASNEWLNNRKYRKADLKSSSVSDGLRFDDIFRSSLKLHENPPTEVALPQKYFRRPETAEFFFRFLIATSFCSISGNIDLFKFIFIHIELYVQFVVFPWCLSIEKLPEMTTNTNFPFNPWNGVQNNERKKNDNHWNE